MVNKTDLEKFKKLSREEQGAQIYALHIQVAELLEAIELDDGETRGMAKVNAELCGCKFCERCDALTDERDSWGFCPDCARQAEAWERDQNDAVIDFNHSKL